MVIYGTLCYIIDDKKLLLLKKAAGLFGGGKWNGLGGKIDIGESPEKTCMREVYKESGLHVSNLKYHGTLKFWFENTNESIIVYVFSTKSFEGNLRKVEKVFFDGLILVKCLMKKCGWTTDTGCLGLWKEKISMENFISIKKEPSC